MKESLTTGISKTTRLTVDRDRTIDFMGDEGRVYATPELVRDIEITCRDCLLEHLDAGEDSVGIHLELDHTAPTLLGMWVEISANLIALDGRRATFEISAQDAVESIAHGKHHRFIVDVEKSIHRLRSKAEKVQAS